MVHIRLIIALISLALSPLSKAADVLVPQPTGPYGTSLSTHQLVDHGRVDPFAPSNQSRQVMVSLFQPVASANCSHVLQDYMPPATAAFEDQNWYPAWRIPVRTFANLKLQVCNSSTSSQSFPLVIFSPALGTTRLFYSAHAQALSSMGYMVVTIDHPYDTDIVEFPDGSTVMGNLTDSSLLLAVSTRAQDVSFVIDELTNSTALTGTVILPNVTMFGHSLGGAAAAAAMVNDSRILGGLNMDGEFVGPVIQQGLSRPFLMFGVQYHNTWSTLDPTWSAIWQVLVDWKVQLNLAKARHYTFSDLPLLTKLLNLDENGLPNGVMNMVGTLDGSRAFEVVSAYIAGFIQFTASGKENSLLEMENGGYPEVTFI